MPNDSLAKTESQGRKKFLFSTVTKQSVCRLLASSSTGLSLKHGDIEDLRKRQKKWTQDLLTAVCSEHRACSGVRAHTHTPRWQADVWILSLSMHVQGKNLSTMHSYSRPLSADFGRPHLRLTAKRIEMANHETAMTTSSCLPACGQVLLKSAWCVYMLLV